MTLNSLGLVNSDIGGLTLFGGTTAEDAADVMAKTLYGDTGTISGTTVPSTFNITPATALQLGTSTPSITVGNATTTTASFDSVTTTIGHTTGFVNITGKTLIAHNGADAVDIAGGDTFANIISIGTGTGGKTVNIATTGAANTVAIGPAAATTLSTVSLDAATINVGNTASVAEIINIGAGASSTGAI